jgi:tRNA (guanine37-N1)-methyltransferase
MLINILTLFPEMFKGPLSESIMKRAVAGEKVTFNIVNIRDFTSDKHHTADQPPYGGGPGMVMMVEPIEKALSNIQRPTTNDQYKHKTILLSAKGKLFTQAMAKELADFDEVTLICGHYEGVDERVAENLVDEEIRIGDYVLTGGELPAMIIADSIVRLLPGVLGDDMSNVSESHSSEGYLEYPQYTRPAEYNGWKVPELLQNGNHAEIEKWRQEHAQTTHV